MKQILVNAPQVGLLLHSARKQKGYSQADIASRLGLTQSRMSKLEMNASALRLDQLLSLCAHLGLELTLREKLPSAKLSVEPARTVSDGDPKRPSASEW